MEALHIYCSLSYYHIIIIIVVIHRRPSGDPVEDVRSHLIQPKLREKERLEHLLEQVQQENKRLYQALVPRKQHLLDTKQKINEGLKPFDKVCGF